MGKFSKIVCRALALLALTLSPVAAQAQDFRDNFPQQFTDSPMGVNLQSGRFSYWLFSFAMGPFAVQRGFNGSGFSFPATIYYYEKPVANGAIAPTMVVNMGNPAVSLGNHVTLVEAARRPVSKSFLMGMSSTRLEFREVIINGAWTGEFTTIQSPGAESWHLARVYGRFEVSNKSGQKFVFADVPNWSSQLSRARLDYVDNADGSRIKVTFDADGRLLFAESNRGFAMRYEYLNGGAQIKVCGFNLAQTYASANTPCSATTYVVTINNIVRSDGLLQPTSVVDLIGQTTTINWGSVNGNLPVCITLPNSSTCEVTNSFGPQPGELTQETKNDQVRVQTDANGNVWTYHYEFPWTNSDDPPQYPGGPPILSASWMTGPGFGAEAHYENGLVKTLASPGSGPNQFEYNGVQLWKAKYPEGNVIEIGRDYIGNPGTIIETPKPGSGLSPVTSTQTFAGNADPFSNSGTLCGFATTVLCDKPIERTDAAGNKTYFTYDPVHGGLLTKKFPAVQVNGTGPLINPVVRYEYTQRYALIKTASGTYVQAATPIWVLTAERTCRTTQTVGNACAGGAADETVTTYEYGPTSGGPNNLLLRGVAVTADGTTLRSCYGYDANGRKISETQPLAGLTVCP